MECRMRLFATFNEGLIMKRGENGVFGCKKNHIYYINYNRREKKVKRKKVARRAYILIFNWARDSHISRAAVGRCYNSCENINDILIDA
jgi:hypothetical protein